jgi:hypothetical protein
MLRSNQLSYIAKDQHYSENFGLFCRVVGNVAGVAQGLGAAPGAATWGLHRIGSSVEDSTFFSTMNVLIWRTPGRYSSCWECSRLKLSLSRVRTSMK